MTKFYSLPGYEKGVCLFVCLFVLFVLFSFPCSISEEWLTGCRTSWRNRKMSPGFLSFVSPMLCCHGETGCRNLHADFGFYDSIVGWKILLKITVLRYIIGEHPAFEKIHVFHCFPVFPIGWLETITVGIFWRSYTREPCSHSCLPSRPSKEENQKLTTSCMSPFEKKSMMSLSLGNTVDTSTWSEMLGWFRLKCFNKESCRKFVLCLPHSQVPCRKTRVASVILLILGALFCGTMSRTSCARAKESKIIESFVIFIYIWYFFGPIFALDSKF